MKLKIFPLLALACMALLGSVARSQANVLVSENFSYGDGGLNGQNGGTGFGSNVWFNSNSSVTGGVAVGGGDSSSKRNFAASLGTTGTVWVRFDWGNSEAPAEWNSYGGLTFYNGTSDGGTESFLLGNPWAYAPTQTRWNISGGSGSPNSTVANFPGMRSAVAKLTLDTGTVELWVGATGATIDVARTPDSSSSGLNLANIQGIRINGWSGNSASQNFDNLIIGTTLDDVNAPTSGTWSNAAGGPWGTAGNWLGNLVATGGGSTADFSTLNITADTTVDLNTARTVGNLVFGDTDTASAAGWTLTGNLLTLGGTTPTITVNALGGTKTATISAVIAGSSGLTKSGTGTLTLSAANTYSGTTTITAGTLQIGDGGTTGILGSGPVSIASGATLAYHRSDDYAPPATQIISGAGTLIKDGSGTLTLSGRNTYSGTTTVQNGVLALANQAALGEGPLNISSGAKVAMNFTGQCFVTQLTLGGAVQAAGTYGSSGSSAANKNDTWFSGTGVINVSATIDHVAMATNNLQAADAAWAAGDWVQVRSALSNVFNDLRLDAQWRSIPHLRYARSFQATGDYAAASATFGTIAAITEYPKIHQIEGAECQTECDRLAQALPARDPEAARVRVTAAPTPGRMLYVSPNGNDANPGTLGQPFATVNQALAANRAAGAVVGGTAIELAAGRYPLASTISLTSADSGTGADAPLSIRATTPGTAVISGSQRLTGFTTVTDTSLLARLPVEAQGKVMQCNLSALGITDFGSIQEQPMVNLSVNGVPQTLARWPNSGFIPVGSMVDNGNIDHNNPSLNRPQIFTWSGDRASRWTTATDAWIQGYLGTNWLYGSVAIGSIDAQAKTITTAWCYNRLSGWPDMKSGAPYSVFNLLEEIDQPGEWYLDRANGMLYWYPSADPATAAVDFSMLSGPMLTANGASHVRIEGLVFESSRGTGVELENSSNCLIAGCTVRNLSGIGVRINGGQQNSMIGCDLHDLEQTACYLSGGDGNTLTPGNHLVANCRFRNFGRANRTTGMSLNGVGHRITHCVFEDGPSSAIAFSGFNFLVEYNEFRNCCTEIDDWGVIYAWGNPTWRGNIWRFNQFSHCGGGYTQGWLQNRYFGTSAFRFDDAVSGQTVYGNVFTHFDLWGQSAGVMGNNSGRDNIYDNNLVTDCRGLNYGYYAPDNHMYLQGVPNGLTSAQLAAFPELANLYDGNGQNYLWRSTTLRVSAPGINAGNSSYADSEWGGWQYIANTNTGTDPGFVDGVEVKKTIDPTLFWNFGMRAIPVDEIGLYDDATRAAWLDNPGMAYWNGSSGNWDASTVNWSASAVTPASTAWNDNGDTTAVFMGSGGAITLAAPLSANGLIFTAPGYTLAGTQPIALNGALTTLDAKTFGASISAPLTGMGGISVAGAGTLTLSGANSYNGTTTVENGTLALSGGDNRLPPGTVVKLGGGGPAAFGCLKLNGCSQELGGLWTADYDNGATAGNRVINGNATPCTLTLNIENGRNDQFDGTLGGSGPNENNFAVKITGGGGLWLRRSITWTGGTTIEDGTLELNSSWWQGNEAYGTFRIGHGATFAVSGRVSPLVFKGVTVEFLAAGGGTLIHRGSPDWLDWRAEWGLTIRSTGGERNLISAPSNFYLNLVDGGDFDIARGSDATCDLLVSVPLVGNGSITKQGNGIMTLSGANSYNGTTTVNSGTLVVETTGTLGNGNLTVANGATCELRNTAGAVSDNAAVTLNGTGSLNLAAGVSETVGTLVIDGIQRSRGTWSAANDPAHFTGSGSLVVTSGPLPENDGVWIGLADGVWSQTSNWQNGTPASGADKTATFNQATGATITLDDVYPIGNLVFEISDYTLSGGTLALASTSGTSTVSVAASRSATISSALTGSVGLLKSGSGTLTLSGANSYSGTTSVNAGTLLVSGQPYFNIGRTTTVAPGAVFELKNSNNSFTTLMPTSIVNGTGTFRLSGNSTLFQAENGVNGTRLTFAMQAGGWIDLLDSSRMTNGGWQLVNWTNNQASMNIASGATFDVWDGQDVFIDALTGSGTVDKLHPGNSPRSLTVGIANGGGTFSGAIKNTGGQLALTKVGNGTQVLSGVNTYSGSTAINVGKLIISGTVSNTSSVSIASGAELELSGTLATSGNLTNDGTLVLTGAPQLSTAGTITNNGTIINSAPGYTLPANLVNNGTVYNLPAAPAGLSATAGEGQVALAWSAVSGAGSYQVKQSLFAGGPYTTVATPTGTSHTATGLTNGTTYYFVVSALNTAGESANSTQTSATPQAQLPLPRQTLDIGTVGLTGSALFTSGTYTLQGAGTGITGTADACRFVYQTASGDCSATIRVQSLSTTGSGTKVGVMIRESLAANAREAGVWVSPGNGILFTRRTSTSGTTAVTASTGKTAPYWVRLTRTGNVFQAFYSPNGSTWTQFGSNRTISMSATTYIGIATTSGTTATLCTGVMTNEAVSP